MFLGSFAMRQIERSGSAAPSRAFSSSEGLAVKYAEGWATCMKGRVLEWQQAWETASYWLRKLPVSMSYLLAL